MRKRVQDTRLVTTNAVTSRLARTWLSASSPGKRLSSLHLEKCSKPDVLAAALRADIGVDGLSSALHMHAELRTPYVCTSRPTEQLMQVANLRSTPVSKNRQRALSFSFSGKHDGNQKHHTGARCAPHERENRQKGVRHLSRVAATAAAMHPVCPPRLSSCGPVASRGCSATSSACIASPCSRRISNQVMRVSGHCQTSSTADTLWGVR